MSSVAWHPNNIFLATGSSDFKARIFSAFIKGIDKNPGQTPFGDKLPFGQCLAEYAATGWVHDVNWSPSGNRLVFVAHDSRIHFVDINSGSVDRLSLDTLPYRNVIFLSEDSVVAGGYDCAPHLFTFSGSWKFAKNIDENKAAGAGKQSGASAARNMFQSKVDMGTTENETTLTTQHQNSINSLQAFAAAGGKVSKFSSTGVDGKVVIWNA